jgi:S-formylglutathione hydrolase FrmB
MKPIYIIIIILLWGYDSTSKDKKKASKLIEKTMAKKTYKRLQGFQTITISNIKVDIYTPKANAIGNIVILPGWNFKKEEWCKQTNLCNKALSMGYTLIMPEMGKSIYASNYYKETWLMMQSTIKRAWVTDTLFKYIQDTFGLLRNNQNNYIMGLSTGAHGTALIVEDLPKLFCACALLSGDYDQSKLKQDQIFIATYGPYNQFASRWKQIDNPLTGCDSLYIPTYIGHGQSDPIIPKYQSEWLYKNLKSKHPKQDIKLSLKPSQQHNFKYWASEVDSILNFFSTHHH